MFIFGGKKIRPGSQIAIENGKQFFVEPFDFVCEVEALEIAKGVWKTINYISEPERLKIITPGSMQISGSQIMIFGGLIPRDEDSSDKLFDVTDQTTELSMTNQSIILDVTVGSIKYGPELSTPSYFISGGYMLPNQRQIYCLGISLHQQSTNPMFQSLGAV